MEIDSAVDAAAFTTAAAAMARADAVRRAAFTPEPRPCAAGKAGSRGRTWQQLGSRSGTRSGYGVT